MRWPSTGEPPKETELLLLENKQTHSDNSCITLGVNVTVRASPTMDVTFGQFCYLSLISDGYLKGKGQPNICTDALKAEI